MLRTIAFLVTAAALTLFTLRCTEAVSILLNVAVLLLGITVCYYTAEYIADIWERTYFDDVS